MNGQKDFQRVSSGGGLWEARRKFLLLLEQKELIDLFQRDN